MRKLIVSMFLSLDGLTAGPYEEMDWVMDNFDAAEMGPDMGRLQESAGAFLLGRQTYQIMANAWPNQTEETSPGADAMNKTPKIVASSTLKEVPWGKYGNAQLVHGNTVEEIRKLKTMPGKDIVTFGSPRLVESLAEAGLVDRFRIWLHPTLLGNGKPFFRGKQPIRLNLVASKVYKNGVVALDYEPVSKK
ncbi:dihydrofolate reductase family protein [Candidatus Bathyarchaeota archaeon]|nr:dihydrofolate reductase family protein [Candidatus Bathyarchaeota archaeon]